MAGRKEKLVEQKATVKTPDYLGAAYNSLAALYCLYLLALFPKYVPVWAVAPMYYSLNSLLVFLAPLLVIGFLWGIYKAFTDWKMGKGAITLALLCAFALIWVAGMMAVLYGTIEPSEKDQLFTPEVQMLLFLSLVQLVIGSYPFSKKFEGRIALLLNWAGRLVSYAIGPGFAAFIAMVGGYTMLWILLLPASDSKSAVVRMGVYYLLFFLAIIKFDEYLRKKKARDSGQALVKQWLLPAWALIGLPLVLATLMQFQITEWGKAVSKAQISLFMLAFAYGLLALMSWKGTFRYEEKESDQKPPVQSPAGKA